jgi:hypothetical protein
LAFCPAVQKFACEKAIGEKLGKLKGLGKIMKNNTGNMAEERGHVAQKPCSGGRRTRLHGWLTYRIKY